MIIIAPLHQGNLCRGVFFVAFKYGILPNISLTLYFDNDKIIVRRKVKKIINKVGLD